MINRSQYLFFIGIDTGVQTGLCIWDRRNKKILKLETTMIHRAMDSVISLQKTSFGKVMVRVEDARMATFKRDDDKHKTKGAGSVMRDAKVWEDFLTDMEIPFELVRPNNKMTKMNAETFRQRTGWKEKTSSHARDACWLVYGL